MNCGCNCAGADALSERRLELLSSCKCERDCRNNFVNAETRLACDSDCLDERSGCVTACGGGFDFANGQLAECQTGADTERNTCYVECDEQQAACEVGCSGFDPGPARDACFAFCFNQEIECRGDCDGERARSYISCDILYYSSTAGEAGREHKCANACCDDTAGGFKECEGLCEEDHGLARDTAFVGYLECISPGVVALQEFGHIYILDDDEIGVGSPTEIACRLVSDRQIADADDDYSDCAEKCTIKLYEKAKVCTWEHTDCMRAAETKRLRARTQCTYNYLAGGSADILPQCYEDADFEYQDDALECCFKASGVNHYYRDKLDCIQSYQTCIRLISCPPVVLTDPPCAEFSEGYDPLACQQLKDAYDTCLAQAQTNCAKDQRECIEDIEGAPDCRECFGFV